ncbi:hypothetical protein H3N56_03440 [Cetobacterium sp. 2A]|uniref:hypothetical protein n=1 Tax=unclassified Cetobacterium TaxID=2630983 RepID=UPI00163C121E|nr:hypothetical protein [Cetobacterium sp. 2A]MBC2855549.1 hypothetical protein [Cetobacterium sp. 2A]
MKKIITCFLFVISLTSLSEVKVTLREPLSFKEMRSGEISYENVAIAEGIIEIVGEDEDIGKLISFEIPPYGMVTNKKCWLKISKIVFEKNTKEIILSSNKHLIKVYGFLDKKEISKNKNADIAEGKYIGYLPINYSVYSKEM